LVSITTWSLRRHRDSILITWACQLPNTIAEELKRLGYTTGLIGKWHLGDLPKYHPTKRGFDEHWGYPGGGHDYFRSEPGGKGYRAPLECNYKTPQAITYITDDTGDECVDFIKRHKDAPVLLPVRLV
jgi:arylsulfatase A-like enzyme